MKVLILLLAIAGCASRQVYAQAPQTSQSLASQAGQSQPKGSVSGTVRDSGTGTPVPDVQLAAFSGDKRLAGSKADSQGHFSFKDLDPGSVRITAMGAATSLAAEKFIRVVAAQEITFDILVGGRANISGTVTDQNGEPVAGLDVLLVARDYAYGQLRYIITGFGATNGEGEYKLNSAQPGRGYLLVVRRREEKVDAISQAPTDPKNRKPAIMPTYYPGVDSPQGAQLITLRAGEQRDHVDMRVLRTPSYCLESNLQPGQTFQLTEQEPATGRIGGTGYIVNPTSGKPEEDGKIRVCDLHPGGYDFKVRQTEGTATTYFGVTPVTISDRDMTVSPALMPQIPVPVEVVWADESGAPAAHVTVEVATLEGVSFPGEIGRSPLDVPGKISFDHLMMKEYSVALPAGLPAGVYVKDVEFSNKSILHELLRPATGSGNAGLRITLGHDGGSVTIAVADKDGKAVADINVIVFPANGVNAATLAAAMVTGKTDQTGTWTSTSLAPGKYLAIATQLPVDGSPETVARLSGGRSKAQEIELAPGGSAQVNLIPEDVR